MERKRNLPAQPWAVCEGQRFSRRPRLAPNAIYFCVGVRADAENTNGHALASGPREPNTATGPWASARRLIRMLQTVRMISRYALASGPREPNTATGPWASARRLIRMLQTVRMISRYALASGPREPNTATGPWASARRIRMLQTVPHDQPLRASVRST